MEYAAAKCDWDFTVYCVAGGVAVSRPVAELFVAGDEQRFVWMDCRVGAVWIFAHHKRRIPKLEICATGFDCGIFLRLDVAADQFDFCFGAGARGGRPSLALFV